MLKSFIFHQICVQIYVEKNLFSWLLPFCEPIIFLKALSDYDFILIFKQGQNWYSIKGPLIVSVTENLLLSQGIKVCFFK